MTDLPWWAWAQAGVIPVDRNGHSALISEGSPSSQDHENTVDRLTLEAATATPEDGGAP